MHHDNTWAEKRPSTTLVSALHRNRRRGEDESIEYWEDDIQPMRDRDVRFITP